MPLSVVRRFVFSITLLTFAVSAFAQAQPESPESITPPALKPVPDITDEQMAVFLKTAEIKSRKTTEIGSTAPIRATLSDGTLAHDAQIQCVDIFRPTWKGAEGTVERNFRDTWKFNVAAFHLGRLVGLRNIPMTVERNVDGKLCGVTWWVDNVWLTEVERRDKGIKPPTTDKWTSQLNTVRVFDQLIYNTDRNQGNLLITPDWQVWLIDHTRAFRTFPRLMKVEPLNRVDQNLLGALKNLNLVNLGKELGPWLRPEEISSILVRRDLIVRFFRNEIRTKGEDSVLTGIPRTTPVVSVP